MARVRFRPSLRRYAAWERVSAMGLLTFALNVTLDGCCDHRERVANDEMHRYWTCRMDVAGAMLFGRRTYELMEDAWPQVARDPKATPSSRDWAKKLEAKPKYVVSTTRRDFPWSNTHHVEGDLTRAVKALKKATPRGLLVGSPTLSAALQRLDLVDEYRFVIHPVVAGHGPFLFSGLQPSLRCTIAGASGQEPIPTGCRWKALPRDDGPSRTASRSHGVSIEQTGTALPATSTWP